MISETIISINRIIIIMKLQWLIGAGLDILYDDYGIIPSVLDVLIKDTSLQGTLFLSHFDTLWW